MSKVKKHNKNWHLYEYDECKEYNDLKGAFYGLHQYIDGQPHVEQNLHGYPVKSPEGISWRINSGNKERVGQKSRTEKQFLELATNWKKETAAYSTMYHKTINNNYLGIIGMGTSVLPFIFKDLQKNIEHWFIALKAITKENPVSKEDIGDLQKMRTAWLNWAKQNNII